MPRAISASAIRRRNGNSRAATSRLPGPAMAAMVSSDAASRSEPHSRMRASAWAARSARSSAIQQGNGQDLSSSASSRGPFQRMLRLLKGWTSQTGSPRQPRVRSQASRSRRSAAPRYRRGAVSSPAVGTRQASMQDGGGCPPPRSRRSIQCSSARAGVSVTNTQRSRGTCASASIRRIFASARGSVSHTCTGAPRCACSTCSICQRCGLSASGRWRAPTSNTRATSGCPAYSGALQGPLPSSRQGLP